MLLRRCLTLLAISLVGIRPAVAQLSVDEKKGIADTLFIGNLTARDLEYEKKPFEPRYAFPLVNLCLDKPLDAADALMALHARSGKLNIAQILGMIRTDIYGDPKAQALEALGVGRWALGLDKREEIASIGPISLISPMGPMGPIRKSAQAPEEISAPLRDSVGKLAHAIVVANERIRLAVQKLSEDEKRILIEGLPRWATQEPTISFDFVKKPMPDQGTILRLLDRVDLPAIRLAGQELAATIQEELPNLKKLAPQATFKGLIRAKVEGLQVELGGTGDDVHDSRDTALAIDFGGNNRYTGRYGAGIGYASVMIDIGDGTNTFDVPDASIGVGLLGVGLAYDLGGTGIFHGKSLCFGAGLAGVGVLFKDGGDDSYSGVSLTEGFGEFGIGMLLDTRGVDHYDAGVDGQGAARTQGVGWLIDKSGDDTYRAGGLIVNTPEFKDAHNSNAQGFGWGYRSDDGGLAGGIGLLSDLDGSDIYIGETYCQAASFWCALGSLYDAAGNDTYTAYHFAQACALHSAGAYLFDLAGDDGYVVKLGACHALGHDYGVAFLLDRAGNDLYAAHDSRPGSGNANGLGIFVDASGDDRYFGPAGIGNPSRGSGSLGIFADLNGSDIFAEGTTDGTAIVRDGWGIAYDAAEVTPHSSDPPLATDSPKPGSKPMPGDAEMETIYAKASQWNGGDARAEVEKNVDQLIAIGEPAFAWMLKHKLASANGSQIQAFVSVIAGVGEPARKLLAPLIASPELGLAKNALAVAIDAEVHEGGPYVAAALKNPKLEREAARAAGLLGSIDTLPDLMLLAASPDRLTALNAVLSLGLLPDEKALSTGEALLLSDELPIRRAALAFVAKFPLRALEVGKRLTKESDPRTSRTGVELLGLVGTQEALEAIAGFLKDPRSGMKISAMVALSGRCPAGSRPDLIALRKDLNPLVRAVAARIDLGR